MSDTNSCAKKQAGDNRLSKDNAALLLVDHQTGLFQLVRDYDFDQSMRQESIAKAMRVEEPTIVVR